MAGAKRAHGDPVGDELGRRHVDRFPPPLAAAGIADGSERPTSRRGPSRLLRVLAVVALLALVGCAGESDQATSATTEPAEPADADAADDPGTVQPATSVVSTTTEAEVVEPPDVLTIDHLVDFSTLPLSEIEFGDPDLEGAVAVASRDVGDREFWAKSRQGYRTKLGLEPADDAEMQVVLDDLMGFRSGTFGECWADRPPLAVTVGISLVAPEVPDFGQGIPLVAASLYQYESPSEADAAYEWQTTSRELSGTDDQFCGFVSVDRGADHVEPCEAAPECSLVTTWSTSGRAGSEQVDPDQIDVPHAVAKVGSVLLVAQALPFDAGVSGAEILPSVEELIGQMFDQLVGRS